MKNPLPKGEGDAKRRVRGEKSIFGPLTRARHFLMHHRLPSGKDSILML